MGMGFHREKNWRNENQLAIDVKSSETVNLPDSFASHGWIIIQRMTKIRGWASDAFENPSHSIVFVLISRSPNLNLMIRRGKRVAEDFRHDQIPIIHEDSQLHEDEDADDSQVRVGLIWTAANFLSSEVYDVVPEAMIEELDDLCEVVEGLGAAEAEVKGRVLAEDLETVASYGVEHLEAFQGFWMLHDAYVQGAHGGGSP